MQDSLNTLITYFEEEKSRLLVLIADCVEEEEYQLAYFHQQALYQVVRQIHNLRYIDDNLYDQKTNTQQWIDRLEKLLESEGSTQMQGYLTGQLSHYRETLHQLNQSPREVARPGMDTILENSINDLLDNNIKGFILYLNKSKNLLLKFRYSRNELQVTIPYIKTHRKNWILDENDIKRLMNLGFNITSNERQLILKLKGSKTANGSTLRLILAKIVYEIFSIGHFQNQSYIQIQPKAGR